MENLYKVTLVDSEGNEWSAVHVDKDEAAMHALAAHTQSFAQHAWEQDYITALPMLRTFDSYDEVANYFQEVHEGMIRFEVK